MATVIMPKMGDAMEEGTLLRWLKEVGEDVAAGDPIAEIETDKVTIEIEASDSGVLTKTLVSEGDTVPIGTTIATIGDEPDVADAATGANGKEPAAAAAPAAEPVAAVAEATPTAAPAAAPAAVTNGVAAPAAQPVTLPANGARASGERLRASPLVKRLAAEHGIDLSQVAGTGPGGRIVKDDIASLLTGAPARPAAAPVEEAPAAAPAPAPVAAPASAGRPTGTVRDLSRIRRTTGKRMLESKLGAPHFYVTVEVDMAAAADFRKQVNAQLEDDESKVSFNDLVIKAAALALRDFPNLNASFQDEAHVVDHPNIDINVAVAIEGGLIAPFIPDADQKSLGAIARMAKDLIGRAREGGLTPEEYQGGTFTISNLGMFDVEEFIAVINPPQAAILAIGSIKHVPVVVDGEVVAGQRMNITLSADHRITDGAEVARYLQAVKRYLQNPMLLALS